MMFGVDGNLDVVADDAGAATAGRHRASIRIGQRYLLVRCGKHLHLEDLEPLHLLPQHRDLLFQTTRLGLERFARLLPVGSVKLLQIARDALLDLRHAPVHLGAREVLVRLRTALNLLPSIATLACVSRPIVRHGATNRAHTSQMAVPLSLRKSAMVL